MGHNIDMIQMFGLPAEMKCPRCKQVLKNYCDEYDIDCGEPNPEPGKWKLHLYCTECDHEFHFRFEVKIKKVKNDG